MTGQMWYKQFIAKHKDLQTEKKHKGFPGFRFLVYIWEHRNPAGCAFRINLFNEKCVALY